jgi:hypothetical protein
MLLNTPMIVAIVVILALVGYVAYSKMNTEEEFRNLDGVRIFQEVIEKTPSVSSITVMRPNKKNKKVKAERANKGTPISQVRPALIKKGWEVIMLNYPWDKFRTDLPNFPNNKKRIQIVQRWDTTNPTQKVYRVHKYIIG